MSKGGFRNAGECWKTILAEPSAGGRYLPEIEYFFRQNEEPAEISFGTSGWRGETGTDFTLRNLRVVASAIADVLLTDDDAIQDELGVSGPEDVISSGVVIGHDNRFLGSTFAAEVMDVLQDRHIPCYYAGESTTPELSAAISRLGASSSINLTPSHNPANWSGLKFNPRDGGPAGQEITNAIARRANALNRQKPPSLSCGGLPGRRVDPVGLYREFLAATGLLDLVRIRRFLVNEDVFVVVDHVHGATRRRPETLLGNGPWLKTLRTEDDPLFGGVAPEPSGPNMAAVMESLTATRRRYRFGVIMDPDGDRIRFTDGIRDITMNHFGGLALHFLHVHKGLRGDLVKSVATSNFGNAVAEGLGISVRETPVGFKNFRPYMLPEADPRALVAYEESDGISAFGNTLEKDATFGLLLALEMMAVTGMTIGDYLASVESEFGAFFPERSGIAVARETAGARLKDRIDLIRDQCPIGREFQLRGKARTVKDLITVDGIKVVLDDGSWFLIRPSGTEPKVRFYVESRTPGVTDDLISLAEQLTREAVRD